MKNIFYATLSANQGGPGFYEIHAEDESSARKVIHEHTNGRWAFLYTEPDQIHQSDQKLLGVLHGPEMVMIPKDECVGLVDDQLFLNCLRGAGVDNWDGWGDACTEYEKLKEDIDVREY